jgi:alpha-beta hydrolase superfamily lysophospholipase
MVSATSAADPPTATRSGTLRGLAFTIWLPQPPAPPARAGVVIVHGAGSRKESHADFARAAVGAGLGALCFDQRGHGASGGRLDGRAVEDVLMFVVHLCLTIGGRETPIAVRGSSMGGCLAILAAARGTVAVDAVVAICPASTTGLARALRAGSLGFDADAESLGALLDGEDLTAAAASLTIPVLLMHAERDEVIPVAHARALAPMLTAPGSRYVEVPGGDHRSIQHDPGCQGVAVAFLLDALSRR